MRLDIVLRTVVILLIILCIRKMFHKGNSIQDTDNDVQKSIVGNVKDIIVKKNAIPSHYREMETMKKKFLGAISNNNEPDWEILIRLGDIYARGMYPFLQPNDTVALQVYRVAANSPDPDIVDLATARYIDTQQHPVDSHDRQGEDIDITYAHDMTKGANDYIRTVSKELYESRKPSLKVKMLPPAPLSGPIFFSGPPTKKALPRIVARTQPSPIDIPERERNNTRTRRQGNTRNTTRDRNIDELTGGKQNTHDHGVTSATKSNIARLKKEFEDLGMKHDSNDGIIEKAMQIFRRVRERSKNDNKINFTSDNLSDAHNVVTSLVPDEYSGTGVTQTEILGLVLWKIGTLGKEIKEGVEETLGKRVASGIERGSSVCATGKVSRCLSVFEGVLDDAQKSVSINVVKKEIAQLAAKVRDDFLKQLGPTGVEAYCSELSVPEYSQRMAEDLRRKVKEQYVTKLNFSHSVIDPLVDVYADAY